MGRSVTFSVTILGSSGSYAAPDNPCTGYLLRSPGATVLLDCGPGTVGPLQTEIDLLDLDAIVLTHCHPDHWMELPVLRNVFTYFAVRTGLPVFGTAETKALNDAVTISGRAETFDWTTIDPSSTIEIGDQSWSFTLADHPVETLGPTVVVDGTACIGGNTLSFAKAFDRVLAIESDATRFRMLEHNVGALGRTARVTCVHGDCLQETPRLVKRATAAADASRPPHGGGEGGATGGQAIVFLDPPWGGKRYKQQERVRLYLSDRDVGDLCGALLLHTAHVVVKVPCNFDVRHFAQTVQQRVRVLKLTGMLLLVVSAGAHVVSAAV